MDHDHHDHPQHHPQQWPTLDFTRHADLNNHEYPSPASPAYSLTYPHAQDFHDPSSSTATGAQFDQIPASTGPHRYRTRYSQRAAEGNQPQNAPRRYPEQPSESSRDSRQATSSMYYNMMLPGPSRPQTPSGAQASLESLNPPPPSASNNTSTPFSERESLSLAIGASGLQDSMRSPQFPLTPASTSSSSSSGFNSRVPSHLLPSHHSRSDSSSTSNPRSASPALSVASALTSVSSSTSAPPSSASGFPSLSNLGSNGGVPQPIPSLAPPRAKQRKQRLFNVDRKAICQYHRDNPNARQEDIAARYGVERSTISKILKHRSKWLNVGEHEGLRVAKHRPSKFPLIELELVAWLVEATASNTSLSDAMIRSKARDIARELGIGEDKFKASSGWVENFKHRNGIRGGKWHKLAKFGRLVPKEPTNTGMDMMGSGMGRSNGMGHNVGMSHQGSRRDDAMDGDEPSSAMTDHISLALQPAWPTASDRQQHSSQQSSSSDLDGYHHHHHGVENQHDPSQHVHHSQDDMHMHHSVIDPQLQHIHTPSQHDPPAVTMPVLIQGAPGVYIQTQSGQEIYHTDGPRLPTAPRQPTLADAEEAIDTLITFLETAGKGIVNPDERDALTQVKCALFQAGSGVPYDRGG